MIVVAAAVLLTPAEIFVGIMAWFAVFVIVGAAGLSQ